mmetsp:Transcript_16653/g.55957  ORF Transcript_16653/g.55957 Transcript_16653/m.55957 type:complete len:157 (+) Transcript_16653:61-531(+)
MPRPTLALGALACLLPAATALIVAKEGDFAGPGARRALQDGAAFPSAEGLDSDDCGAVLKALRAEGKALPEQCLYAVKYPAGTDLPAHACSASTEAGVLSAFTWADCPLEVPCHLDAEVQSDWELCLPSRKGEDGVYMCPVDMAVSHGYDCAAGAA